MTPQQATDQVPVPAVVYTIQQALGVIAGDRARLPTLAKGGKLFDQGIH